MTEFIQAVFTYKFLGYTALAAVLAGISCGIIGTYIVSRKLVFMSGGITHASFGGIGLAYFLQMNPILGGMVFAVLSALGIELFSRKGKISEDTATGVLWGLGMSVGTIFIFLTEGYAPNLMSFLFGNILMVKAWSVWSLLALDAVLILLMIFCFRTIVYTAFDREYARSQKMPVGWINCVMMLLIAVTIVLNITTMGIILLISLLTMPVVIAGSLTKGYARMMVYASVTAVFGLLVGLFVSYTVDVPMGAASVGVLAVLYGLVRLVRWLVRLFHPDYRKAIPER